MHVEMEVQQQLHKLLPEIAQENDAYICKVTTR